MGLVARETCVLEEVPSLLLAKRGADVAENFPQRFEGRGCGFAQVCLALWERHFNWVEIGSVQELESGGAGFEDYGDAGAFVDREVAEGHDVSGLKGWSKLGFDPEIEHHAVHGDVVDPRRLEPGAAQPGDEDLRVTLPEESVSLQTFAKEAVPASSRHPCGDRRLVDEHQATRPKPHQELALSVHARRRSPTSARSRCDFMSFFM